LLRWTSWSRAVLQLSVDELHTQRLLQAHRAEPRNSGSGNASAGEI